RRDAQGHGLGPRPVTIAVFRNGVNWTFAGTAGLMRSRCAGLAQGLGAGKTVVLQALGDDARHGRILVEIALEHPVARRVTDEAEIGHGHAVAVAVDAGRLVAGEMQLVGVEARREPVP